MGQGIRLYKALFQVVIAVFMPLAVYAAEDFFGVTISQTSYAGEEQISQQDKQYSAATPYVNVESIWGRRESFHQIFKLEGFAVLPMSDSVDFGAAIPELYYKASAAEGRRSVVLGRKKEVWSELDSKWKLGLWQPLVRWDSALPIEQGLTGVFFQFKKPGSVRFVFMGSPLYLPDQQPAYREDDGRIVSSNRWFRAPITSVSLQNTNGDVFYEVREPSVEDVVVQPSGATMVYLGDDEYGLFGKISFTDKVANQFHLGIDTKDIFSIKNINFTAPIYPVTVRHQLLTLETGYGWDYSRLVFSRNIEKYKTPELPKDFQQTELIDAVYDGVIYTQRLIPFGIKRTTTSLSYVRRDQANDPGKSTLIRGDIEASTQRFSFDEIVGFDIQKNFIRTFRQELDVNFKYVYSITDNGEWLQAGMHYKYYQQWIWSLSGDVFGVPDNTPSKTSFISKFRGNDRIMGSLTYVF